MGTDQEDFWPDLSPATLRTPASILKTQATALSTKTKGLLGGEVETWTYKDLIYHRFYIVVPALDNYRYSLFRIHHPPTLFPVSIDEEPRADITQMLPIDLRDEEQLQSWLKACLNSRETRRILESLMAQAVA